MSSAAQSWLRLVLAGTALAAAAAGAGVLWPALPDLGGTEAAGPVLQQARRQGVLHVALRSYARPAQPGEALPLSLFTAPRVDYSLHRLRHYTGTAPE